MRRRWEDNGEQENTKMPLYTGVNACIGLIDALCMHTHFIHHTVQPATPTPLPPHILPTPTHALTP